MKRPKKDRKAKSNSKKPKTRRVAGKLKIGLLHSGSKNNSDIKTQIDALFDVIGMCGFPRQDLDIQPSYAEDHQEDLETLAKTLVGMNLKILIAAGGSASAYAAQAATASMANPPPVVFTSVADPADLTEKNMTGVCARTSALDAERLKWLQVLMPTESTFYALTNSARPNFDDEWKALQDAAKSLNVQTLTKVDVPSTSNRVENDIDDKLKMYTSANPQPLLVTADPLFNNHRRAIVTLVQKYNFAAIYQWREFVDAKGLMSFGTKLTQAYRIAGAYAGLILAKKNGPDELPVAFAGTELVINAKAAKDLSFTIPPLLLAAADDLVEK
jgi:putative ABC transport system substrate-binding protein